MTTPTPHTSLEVLALRMARQLRELAELLEMQATEHDALKARVDEVAAESWGGYYETPRECVCGDSHLARKTYWAHRLAAETAAA